MEAGANQRVTTDSGIVLDFAGLFGDSVEQKRPSKTPPETIYEASVELMERVINAFPIQPEEREKVSRLDRIIYAVRGAYIFGYMSAVDTLNDAMRAFVADFAGGGVHSSPNSLQDVTAHCSGREGGLKW